MIPKDKPRGTQRVEIDLTVTVVKCAVYYEHIFNSS